MLQTYRYRLQLRWKSLIKSWEQIDWFLFLLVTGLTFFAGLMIRSTELNRPITNWWQHWLVGSIGVVASLFLARWRYEILIEYYWWIYGFVNASLLAVIFLGVTTNGAQSWINIGGFNMQPSEFAKLGLIITLAAILHKHPASKLTSVFRALAIAAVPWVLIMLQPDLGTGLVFGAITLGMLYWANANPGWLLLLISPLVSIILYNVFFPGWLVWAVAMSLIGWFTLPWRFVGTIVASAGNFVAGQLGAILWSLLKDYQKDRLTLFLHPETDPLGGGYHLIQSRIAIGAGQLWGKGIDRGTQTQLNFIPEQHTDFIFSAVGEELGFVGSLCVILVFWSICLRLVFIAYNAKESFGSLLAIGVLSTIVFQVLVNISMTIGLAPITGIPLPWMSYGGSSLLTNFLALGVVESVANYRQKKKRF